MSNSVVTVEFRRAFAAVVAPELCRKGPNAISSLWIRGLDSLTAGPCRVPKGATSHSGRRTISRWAFNTVGSAPNAAHRVVS